MSNEEPIDSKDVDKMIHEPARLNNDELKKLRQETTQKSMEDGLWYIPFSLILLLVSASVQMPYLTPFIALIIVFGPKAIECLREKYTYPRIGYVKLQEEAPQEMGRGIIGFLFITFLVPISMVIIMLSIEITLSTLFQWLPFAFGVIMVGPSLYLVDATGSRIFYLFGIAASSTGFLISYLISQGILGFILYMLGWSIVTMIVGILLFLRFVSKYPVIETKGFEISE